MFPFCVVAPVWKHPECATHTTIHFCDENSGDEVSRTQFSCEADEERRSPGRKEMRRRWEAHLIQWYSVVTCNHDCCCCVAACLCHCNIQKIHACCHFQLIVVVCLSLPLSFIVTATAVTIIIVASAGRSANQRSSLCRTGMGPGSYPVLQMYWRTAEAALHRSHLHPIVLPPVAVVVPPARDCCLCGPFHLKLL